MSLVERRAWIGLLTLCPAYFVYFTILLAFPDRLATFGARIALFAVVATCHALLSIGGNIFFAIRGHAEDLGEDERDRAIDARSTRAAYFALLAGMISVGCIMPFSKTGWQIVNAALLAIVISEILRQLLVIHGYRRARLAF